ncbi:hypothetical protein [Sulfurovum mangrovi]|uniref:hypothetical protein n=1 Tax=Sulfurovum mangrovi TaxID=2893889 RepID=UPI001E2F6A32|nr:hypothetical protein [Sulfurovum mangrovi]UFH58267.1 hypothetical protein LN246_07860 [Sulfurovum mangrovi]
MKFFFYIVIFLCVMCFFLVSNFIYCKAFFEAKTGVAVSTHQYNDCRIDNLNALISESNASGKAILLKFDHDLYHLITVNTSNLIIDKNKIVQENVKFNKNKKIIISNKNYTNPVILAVIDINNYYIINKSIVNENQFNHDGIKYIEYFLKFKR